MRALLAAVLFALAPPPAGQRWITLNENRLTILSAAQEARTLEIAYELVGVRREAEAFLGNARAPKSSRIFIFPTRGSFAPWLDAALPQRTSDTSVSVRSESWGTFHLIQADDPAGVPRLLPHLLVHDVLDVTHPTLPLWVREGLAEYWSGYRVYKRYPAVTRIQDHVITLKTQKWLSPRELFALDASSPLYDENRRRGMLYAQSWLFVHTLMKGSAKQRKQLARFIELADELPAGTAFARAFDTTPEDFAEQAFDHFQQFDSPVHPRSPFPTMKKLDELPRTAKMSRDDVLFELAQLLAAAKPENAALADEFLAGVSATHPRAQALRLILSADRLPAGDATGPRGLFEKAAQLDPTSVRAWMGLGTTYIHSADDPAPGIAAMEKASALEPWNDTLRFYLVELLLRDRNRMSEATRIAETLSRNTTHGEIRFHLARLLTEVRSLEDEDSVLRGIESAMLRLSEDDLDGALRLIDEILPRIEDETLLAETRKWREEIERRIAHQP